MRNSSQGFQGSKGQEEQTRPGLGYVCEYQNGQSAFKERPEEQEKENRNKTETGTGESFNAFFDKTRSSPTGQGREIETQQRFFPFKGKAASGLAA